jgi:spermidine synthase
MKLHQFFRGEVVEEIESFFNGEIQVIRHLGEHKIIANGLLQSGGVIKNLWAKPIQHLKTIKHPVENILLLGLGGGTLIHLFSKYYPQAKCTAIEIDPEMIRLAKHYFGLQKSSLSTKVICQDAFELVAKSSKSGDTYSLVIVDLFNGSKPPERLRTKKFLRELTKVVPKGIIIFNCLFSKEHEDWTQGYIETLDCHFSQTKIMRNLSNMFIFAVR